MSRLHPDEFEQIISDRSEPVQAVARAGRALILDVLPECFEVVWTQQKTAGYGTGPKKMTEHFGWIALANKHVTFGFFYATELDDPAGILEGTGKLLRHVKLRSLGDVQRPELRALLQQAIGHRVPPPRPLES